MNTSVASFAAACFLPMILEAVVAARHDERLRAAAAFEPPDDVFRAMRFAYPGAFLLMLAEGAVRSRTFDRSFFIGSIIFVIAKALKYWAIATLGERWTFRVLVPPMAPLIRTGPYRWMRHPNYAAVLGELVATAVAMHAFVMAAPAVGGFAFLMRRRIAVEEKALARG